MEKTGRNRTSYSAKTLKPKILRLKHGHICPHTGKIFWGYNSGLKSGEYWMTPEKFKKAKEKQKLWERRQLPSSSRKTRNIGPKAAARRSEYDRRKRCEDPAGFRAKVALKMRNARKKNLKLSIASRCRSRINSFLKSRGIRKNKRTLAIVGCSWDALRQHIENQFAPGMSWQNRGMWHIDHIVPLASATTEQEFFSLCHYTNLQPLWALDNQRKQSRTPDKSVLRHRK